MTTMKALALAAVLAAIVVSIVALDIIIHASRWNYCRSNGGGIIWCTIVTVS